MRPESIILRGKNFFAKQMESSRFQKKIYAQENETTSAAGLNDGKAVTAELILQIAANLSGPLGFYGGAITSFSPSKRSGPKTSNSQDHQQG